MIKKCKYNSSVSELICMDSIHFLYRYIRCIHKKNYYSEEVTVFYLVEEQCIRNVVGIVGIALEHENPHEAQRAKQQAMASFSSALVKTQKNPARKLGSHQAGLYNTRKR